VLTYTEKNETVYRGATLGKAEVDGTHVKKHLNETTKEAAPG
jgi:hypothetical protein